MTTTLNSQYDYSTSHFNYHTDSPIENSCQRNYSQIIRPLGVLNAGDGPYTFVIEPQGEAYLQMDGIDLYLRCQIMRSDGTECGAADIVAPENDLFGKLWSKINVTYNETSTNGQAAEYTDLKNALETQLSYGGDSRDIQLPSRMFYLDTPGQVDTFGVNRGDNNENDVNEGYIMRYNKTRTSKIFEMFGPILQSFFRSDKFLAPGNKLVISFVLNDMKKLLCHSLGAGRNFKIKFLEFYLQTWRIKNPREFSKLKRGYLERYNFQEGLVQCFTVPQGYEQEHIVTQTGGVIPAQMVVVQVDAAAWAGAYNVSAYNFQHFNIKSTSLTINGEQRPNDAIQFDWREDSPRYLEGYNYTLKNIGIYRTNIGCCLNEEAFKSHSFIMVHDNTPDRCASHHTHKSETGHVVLNLSWHQALEQTTLIFVYSSFAAFMTHTTGDLPFFKGIK